MTDRQPQTGKARQTRAAWEKPTIQRVGDVGAIFKGGGGKLSITLADSGDNRKPKGQG
jgi:hypothetical protein